MTDKSNHAPPFSLRLTFEERAQLEDEAGVMPLGAYIRAKLLVTPSPRQRTFRQPVENQQILGQLLGAIGQSRLSNNLNQLAKATHSGALPVTPETQKAIMDACSEVHEMRQTLIKALGLLPEEGRKP